jgi:hypothetical protein
VVEILNSFTTKDTKVHEGCLAARYRAVFEDLHLFIHHIRPVTSVTELLRELK